MKYLLSRTESKIENQHLREKRFYNQANLNLRHSLLDDVTNTFTKNRNREYIEEKNCVGPLFNPCDEEMFNMVLKITIHNHLKFLFKVMSKSIVFFSIDKDFFLFGLVSLSDMTKIYRGFAQLWFL